MWLDDLADYLDAQGVTGGVTGWMVAVERMPDTPDQVLALYFAGGEDEEPLVLQPNFQIRGRGAVRDSAGVTDKMIEAADLLKVVADQVIGSTRFVLIRKAGDIVHAGEDANERPELSLTMRTIQED